MTGREGQSCSGCFFYGEKREQDRIIAVGCAIGSGQFKPRSENQPCDPTDVEICKQNPCEYRYTREEVIARLQQSHDRGSVFWNTGRGQVQKYRRPNVVPDEVWIRNH